MDKEKPDAIEGGIHWLSAQFKSKKIEHDFRQHTLAEDKKRGLAFILILQLASVLFVVMELKVQPFSGLSGGLFTRIFLIIGSFCILFFSLKTRNETHFDSFFFLLSGAMVLVQSYTGYLRPFGIVSVAVTEVIIIMVIYLILTIPLCYRVIPALTMTLFSNTIYEIGILAVHHGIVHFVGILFSIFLNRSKRNQFLLLNRESLLKRELEKSENEIVFISKQLAEQNKILKEQSTKDPLTGVHNRRSFYEFAEEQWSKAVRKKEDCSVIMIDIDHFKQINDNHGHLTGDRVLKGVVNAIKKLIRAYDRFGRWGGEEFILYLPETDIEQTQRIAERFRKTVEEEYVLVDDQKICVTISLGVSSKLTSETLDLGMMIDQADSALYAAKTTGRNRVCRYRDVQK